MHMLYSLYDRLLCSLVRSLNACSNRQRIPTLFFSYFCPGRVVGFTRSGVQLLLCPLPVRHYPAWSVFQPSCYPIISLPNRHNYFQSLLYPSLWSSFFSFLSCYQQSPARLYTRYARCSIARSIARLLNRFARFLSEVVNLLLT